LIEESLIGGIISYLIWMDANKERSIASFINNLEIIEIFKDKDGKKEASVMDFIN